MTIIQWQITELSNKPSRSLIHLCYVASLNLLALQQVVSNVMNQINILISRKNSVQMWNTWQTSKKLVLSTFCPMTGILIVLSLQKKSSGNNQLSWLKNVLMQHPTLMTDHLVSTAHKESTLTLEMENVKNVQIIKPMWNKPKHANSYFTSLRSQQ